MKKINLKLSFTLFIITIIFGACKNDNSKQKKDEFKKVATRYTNKTQLFPTLNIKPNEKIISPKKIRVNSEGVWFASEGELGWIQLKDNEGNELARGILSAEGDWMKEGPVMFSTILTFDIKNIEKGKLVIHNDPGPGDGDEAGKNINFEIPITF
ncbi:hypothetical protein [Tenacibaculum ovolyticum]|uniref:hypothetical protein n=1 Tax=Tenacibaculum ovolyticum TaxID=104270 RepID=UPI000407A7E3|nr:hypothetical protein [Tenacibaculum ovolyticum]